MGARCGEALALGGIAAYIAGMVAKRCKTTPGSNSGSFSPRSRPDGGELREPLTVDSVERVQSDLRLLADYDHGVVSEPGDDPVGAAARALVAAVRDGDGGGGGDMDAMRAGVVAGGLVLPEAGLEIEPGTLALCCMMAAGEGDAAVAEGLVAAVLGGAVR